jgi:hypothetical protein
MPKTTTAVLPQITISWLKEQGYFKHKSPPLLKGIRFTTTKCYFGSKRFWFICNCGKRVGVLYESDNGFECRKCLNLAYPSQNIKKSIRNDVMLSAVDGFLKAQELEDQVKRTVYRGEPTKKQKKIDSLYFKLHQLSSTI